MNTNYNQSIYSYISPGNLRKSTASLIVKCESVGFTRNKATKSKTLLCSQPSNVFEIIKIKLEQNHCPKTYFNNKRAFLVQIYQINK